MKKIISKIKATSLRDALEILAVSLFMVLVAFGGYKYNEFIESNPTAEVVDYSKNIELKSNNTIFITGKIDEYQVIKVYSMLKEFSPLEKFPVYVIINSSGGSLTSELKIINILKNFNRVTVGICIQCHSAAYAIFRQLDHKFVLEHSLLMQHHAKTVKQIEIGTDKQDTEDRLGEQLDERHIELSKIPDNSHSKNLILSEQTLLGSAAVKLGWADKVVQVSCSTEIYQSFYKKQYVQDGIGVVLIKSKCPSVDVVAVAAISQLGEYGGTPIDFVPREGMGIYFHLHAKQIRDNALDQDFNSLEDFHD